MKLRLDMLVVENPEKSIVRYAQTLRKNTALRLITYV